MALAVPTPFDAVRQVRREAERAALRARNGIKLAAGVDRPQVGRTPKEVVWSFGRAQLWHYRSDRVRFGPPLLIVMSLVSRSYVLDLAPDNSFVGQLLDAGFDVYLVDWGTTDERDAGNTLEDYVDGYLTTAVQECCADAGSESVNVFGYCFGGVLSLLLAARHPELPIASLTTMATPVDLSKMGLMANMFREGRLDPDAVLDDTGNVSPDVIRSAFRVLKPTAEVAQYATLWENMWNDDYLAGYQAMGQWAKDHIPFSGATLRQVVDGLIRENGICDGTLVMGGEKVSLQDIAIPFLNVLAERDHIVPLESAAPLIDLVGSEQKDELRLPAGHVGLVAGRTAAKVTVPAIIEFLQRRSVPLPTSEEKGA